jgi:hypothetical protein
MKVKICKYCGEEFTGKSFNGCCCIIEGEIIRSEINANYYAKNREIILSNKYAGMLDACVRQFGENTLFDAAILGHMKFDWKFAKKGITIDNEVYSVIKNYAYIVYKTQKIKIKTI